MICRDEAVERLGRLLVGPGLGEPHPTEGHERELVRGRLSLAYMMGMLFPQRTGEDSASGGDEDGAAADEDEDDPLSMAAAMLPSSLGMSLCIKGGSVVRITARAALYEPEAVEVEQPAQSGEAVQPSKAQEQVPSRGRQRRPRPEEAWRRQPLESEEVLVGVDGLSRRPIFGGLATIEVVARPLPSGDVLLTASLANTAVVEKAGEAPSCTLFQVGMVAEPIAGEIVPYPVPPFAPPTEDERELRIIFGATRPYAAGHGVATDWTIDGERCTRVETRAIPTAHVWRPVFDRLSARGPDGSEIFFPESDIFSLAKLASGELGPRGLAAGLEALASFYELWISQQAAIEIEKGLEVDAGRIIDRCRASVRRMREGIQLLAANAVAYRSFVLANKAMLYAMAHAARASGRGRADGLQGPFELGQAETGPIDYSQIDAAWRPFQLAFLMQILPSLVNEDHQDRNVVDVLWFATGGGKTEAYLLAAAFELFRRRLVHGNGGGVGVINRYTYRFLTADQFQRTAGMICAMELVRHEQAATGDQTLGDEPFSIGLYVGGDVSPNRFSDTGKRPGALQCLQMLLEAREPRAANPFPIEACPSCGTLLVPSTQQRLPDGAPDLAFYGFESSATSFLTKCPDEGCRFHGGLPVSFIDDQLYRSPPSFLLGTIDKFAMVPWNDKAARLLGVGTGRRPPTLIIQDELHLISGPLGTLAGIYEAAFEVLIRGQGASPKVIASTATIRNAGVQCQRIYGRSAMVFPSPGLRAEDSFFSKLDVGNRDRSRLYAGVMAQGLRSTIAASWAMAATLQVVHALGLEGKASEAELDAYWTLVAYHNSKRELGRIANATRDEIPTRLQVYAGDQARERPTNFQVLELKAHSEVPVPQARQMLGRRHSPAEPAIDIVPCTNIISVGVDIDRLGLMLVNGQPKLSAEYIQATSRVGRGTVPGLVLACYAPSKPRDRSHYEAFRDYHDRFYSFVEPTSVTPGALPAMERALHAALVTVVRHGAGLQSNQSARNFDPAAPPAARVIEALKDRLFAAYPEPSAAIERNRLEERQQARIDEWHTWAAEAAQLGYTSAPGQIMPVLLVRFGDRRTDGIGWHTLQSMRHVDKELVLEG